MSELSNQERFDAICRFLNTDVLPEQVSEELWNVMGGHVASVFSQDPERIIMERGDVSCAYNKEVVLAVEYAFHAIAPTKKIGYVDGEVAVQDFYASKE